MSRAATFEQTETAARAALYGLLAHGFAAPSPDAWRRVREILLPACLELQPPSRLAALLAEVGEAAPGTGKALAVAHLELFPPIASPDAPGYETAYRGEDLFRQVDLLADIAGFYRAHGVRSGGTERERPDHIVVELEFMSFLARKELLALQRGDVAAADVCRTTAAAFLRDHLACWAPAFGRRAARVAGHPWYRSLGHLLATWVEADAAGLGAGPVEVVDEPLPQPPPDDGVCGPCPLVPGGSA